MNAACGWLRPAGADLALFPELFLPGYNCARIAELAQPADGDWTRRLSLLARQAGCALVLGYAEREGASVYNSAVAIGADGAPLANYRKIQLYGPREAALFEPGDGYCLFDLGPHRVGL